MNVPVSVRTQVGPSLGSDTDRRADGNGNQAIDEGDDNFWKTRCGDVLTAAANTLIQAADKVVPAPLSQGTKSEQANAPLVFQFATENRVERVSRADLATLPPATTNVLALLAWVASLVGRQDPGGEQAALQPCEPERAELTSSVVESVFGRLDGKLEPWLKRGILDQPA